MSHYKYTVKFFDKVNLIEERTTRYRETGKFPRVKPYKEHVHTGWKYEGKDYDIWVVDSFYFVKFAVILFLLQDYYDYGVYTNMHDIIKSNGSGDILWDKTIN